MRSDSFFCVEFDFFIFLSVGFDVIRLLLDYFM